MSKNLKVLGRSSIDIRDKHGVSLLSVVNDNDNIDGGNNGFVVSFKRPFSPRFTRNLALSDIKKGKVKQIAKTKRMAGSIITQIYISEEAAIALKILLDKALDPHAEV